MSYSSYIEYNKLSVSVNTPNSAGVYIIRVMLTNGDWQRIYVGQAKNLRERLLDHLQDSEPNKCLRDHVKQYKLYYAWIEISRQDDRNREEAAKINKYNPECNKQKPSL